MRRSMDLGFQEARRIREERYPIALSARIGEKEEEQLAHVKEYMREIGDPPMSASDVVRAAIRFAHIFCLQQEAQIEEKKEMQEQRRKTPNPDVFVIPTSAKLEARRS
jgi:hypothetical protein